MHSVAQRNHPGYDVSKTISTGEAWRFSLKVERMASSTVSSTSSQGVSRLHLSSSYMCPIHALSHTVPLRLVRHSKGYGEGLVVKQVERLGPIFPGRC